MFSFSEEAQADVFALLQKNRDGTINHDELKELDEYLHFEHLMRTVKIRAFGIL